MSTNDYHIVTHWRVQAKCEEVYETFMEPGGLARWWPSVYLCITPVEPGDAQGIGAVNDFYTKGWLPYTIRWRLRVASAVYPESITIEAQGDFVGRGIWTLVQDGPWVEVTYDWRIRAEKPLFRQWSWLIKPAFTWNHLWAMRKGEESLRLELLRGRAATPEERAKVSPPPGPTFGWLVRA